ncbi:MAG: nitrite reductase (NAD(P)H) small subunit [Acidobacteria bacterium]|nr:nitrite reductase (NAD(P)H) small subunit [Acidobacteriota bacterium]MBI3427036.1 nitrite reductase (NAD(P)H) small subunit [Acidobacteriota bacterium]
MSTTTTTTTKLVPTDLHFNLGALARIPPGEGKEFEIAGELIAVFRLRDGRVYAVQAKCPHREGALADGITGGGTVVCPMHSFKFDLATGAPLGHDCAALRTYAVSVNAVGEIILQL